MLSFIVEKADEMILPAGLHCAPSNICSTTTTTFQASRTHQYPVAFWRHLPQEMGDWLICIVPCSVQVHWGVSERYTCAAGEHNPDQGTCAGAVFPNRSANTDHVLCDADIAWSVLSHVLWPVRLIVPLSNGIGRCGTGGLLGDRLDRTHIIAFGCFLWGVMTMCIGLSHTLTQVCRLASTCSITVLSLARDSRQFILKPCICYSICDAICAPD